MPKSPRKSKKIQEPRVAIVLVEGDILTTNDHKYKVEEGEVTIYTDRKISEQDGNLIEVTQEAVVEAFCNGATIFDLEDIH